MHIFISAGEPSGDLHGSNLARAIRQLDERVHLSGLGGRLMQHSGCTLVYPLAQHAVMGLWPAIKSVPFFWNILRTVEDWFRQTEPDLVVLIDNPGFNWHVARCAKKYDIPVWYFVPPQLWAWAGWRVRKMRRLVERVLSGLPFEAKWYRKRGVATDYIGHPYCDALTAQPHDESFLRQQRGQSGTVIALLPGSRSHEVQANFPTLFRTANIVTQDHPNLRFLVACYRDEHARWIADYVARQSRVQQPHLSTHSQRFEIHVGKTTEIIQLARVCAAVSGSVTLELLYHAKPSVVVYRISPLARCLKPLLLKCRYITLVNLLADRMVFPEFVSVTCPARQVAQAVHHWLKDPLAWQHCRETLMELRQRFFQPGACRRAAQLILNRVLASCKAA